MQPQKLIKLEETHDPLIAGETITGTKPISQLSDEELEKELRQIAPRLTQSNQALEAARTNHNNIQSYAESLYAVAIQRDLQTPVGYQSQQTTSITIVGGADSIESIFRKYRGFLESSISIDGEKFAKELQPLIRDGQLLIDIPAKVEQKNNIVFDYEALGKIQPEIVIKPELTHDPLRKAATNGDDNGNTEGKA